MKKPSFSVSRWSWCVSAAVAFQLGASPRLASNAERRTTSILPAAETLTNERVPIAEIDSIDIITFSHVNTLLAANGFEPGFGSDLALSFTVPRDQAKNAVAVLTHDASVRQYPIRIRDQSFPTAGHEQRAVTVPVFLPYRWALQASSTIDGLDIRRLLRQRQVTRELPEFPFVSHLEYKKRRYLSSEATAIRERTAYRAEIYLADGPQEVNERIIGFTILDDGKLIRPRVP